MTSDESKILGFGSGNTSAIASSFIKQFRNLDMNTKDTIKEGRTQSKIKSFNQVPSEMEEE
jgi:hypothetical protein